MDGVYQGTVEPGKRGGEVICSAIVYVVYPDPDCN